LPGPPYDLLQDWFTTLTDLPLHALMLACLTQPPMDAAWACSTVSILPKLLPHWSKIAFLQVGSFPAACRNPLWSGRHGRAHLHLTLHSHPVIVPAPTLGVHPGISTARRVPWQIPAAFHGDTPVIPPFLIVVSNLLHLCPPAYWKHIPDVAWCTSPLRNWRWDSSVVFPCVAGFLSTRHPLGSVASTSSTSSHLTQVHSPPSWFQLGPVKVHLGP
jgi:hypothetical protein